MSTGKELHMMEGAGERDGRGGAGGGGGGIPKDEETLQESMLCT